MKKNTIAINLLVLMLCANAQHAIALEKVRIGWFFTMANAPILIAKEKGFYLNEGIDAEILSFTNEAMLQEALSTQLLDMAYVSAPPIYHWYTEGLKSKILAKVHAGHAAIVIHTDSNIESLPELKKKTLASTEVGSGLDVLLRGFILRDTAKLDPDKDLNILPMLQKDRGTAVESKRVDAALMWEPFITQSLLKGKTKILFDINKSKPYSPWYVIMSLTDFVDKNPLIVTKVLRAHINAIKYLNSTPYAGNSIIAKHFKLESVVNNRGVLFTAKDIIREARKRIFWDWNFSLKDLTFVQQLMSHSYRLGYINQEVSINDLVDLSFIHESETASRTAYK